MRTAATAPNEAFITLGQLDNAIRGLGAPAFERLVDTVALARGYGDAWGPALVLSGIVDAWFEHDVAVWDIAPFPVLFEEAGGTFTTACQRRGRPARHCAHPALHSAAEAIGVEAVSLRSAPLITATCVGKFVAHAGDVEVVK